MGDQNPQDFAEKVLQSLKKSNRAVDLSASESTVQEQEQEQVQVQVQVQKPAAEDFSAQSADFRALGQPSGSGGGPGSGGNKDIVIIPGYGGAAATSVSQINFYWNAPTTPDSTGVDTNVRSTIYNYATTGTQPVLAFGGYDGTNLYKPFANYGGGTGLTAKIWIYPTLGRMDADYMYFNIGTGATNDNGALYYDSAALRLRFGLGSGTAKTIAYTDDIPTIAAIATTAASVFVAVTDANATHYPLFANATNASGLGISSDTNLTYNPSTNVLTVGTVSAAFTGNLTGFASTAYATNVTATDANATHFITFVNASSGAGLGQSTDTNLTYNPSTNTLTAGAFSGPLTGNVTGFAQTATSVNVAAGAANASHFITFTTGTSGSGLAISADTQLTYNPSTDTLSSTNISATTVTASLTGNVTGNVTGFAQTATSLNIAAGAANALHFITFTTGTSGSGLGMSADTQFTYNPSTDTLSSTNISATTVTASLTGNVTGNLTGFASTALATSVTATNAAASHFITFVNASSGAALGQSTDTDLTYNPSTNILTSGTFSGALTGNVTGNVSGFATTATSVNVAAGAAAANHFLLFSPSQTGSGVALSSDAQLTYNPNTDTLTASNFVGTVVGTIAGVASTANNLGLQSTDLNTTHYLVFSNLTSTSAGAGAALSTRTTVTLNPNTNALSVGTGNVTANGVIVGSALNTINTSSGNLSLDSNGGQTNINDNVVISGNLTVQGTTITVDSTVSTIVDPVIVIGSGVGGTHSTLDNNQDRGLEFRWSNAGTATTGFFGFSDTDGKFKFIPNASIPSANVYSGTAGTAVFFTVEANLVGNASGTAATYTNFFGTLVGNVTGNVTGFASTALSTNVTATNAAATHFITFVNASSGSGLGQSTDTDLTYNPSTNLLTAGGFSGPLTGNVTGNLTGFATTANSVNVAVGAANATHFITFTTGTSGSGLGMSADTQLTYNPSTDTLSSTNISATTVTASLTGNVTGNVTGFAQTSTSVNVAAGAANALHFITFTTGTSGSGLGMSADTQFTYNPSTDTLSSTNISATTVTASLTGNVTGNVTGFASTAYAINVTATDANATHFITFVNASSGSGLGQSTDTNLTYNPSTNTLTAGSFSGAFSGNITGFAQTATSVNVAAGAANASHFITFTTGTSGSGLGMSADTQLTYNPSTDTLSSTNISATTVTASLTGNVTGNVTGFASTAYATNVTATDANATHFITFVNASSGSGLGQSTDTNLTYNPSTNTLTTSTFSGALTGNVTGNVSGFATTATSVNVAAAAASGAHYLLMTTGTSGSGLAVSTDASLSYVPSTDTLTVSTIAGSGAGLTISATTGLTNNSYLTIQTVAGDDSATSDFFIRGITSTAVSKFSVDANGNLRATTKSFDIDHPTKEGYRLVYGVLEGPEHGVYHRGTVEGRGNLLVELPEYWSELVHDDFTVSLTPYGNYGVHIVEKSKNSFIIAANTNFFNKKIKYIKVDFTVIGSRKDAPLVIEQKI